MYYKTLKLQADLILRLKKGDEAAFKTIYEQYYAPIYSFIFSFVKQKQLSEEILQESFIVIWIQRETLDDAQAIEPLLFTICRRKVLDAFRKITSTEAMKKQLIRTLSETANSTEEEVLYNDLLRHTHEAVSKLPAQQQIVFKLSRFEGLSYDEIASQLQLSRNTVKNHLVAALKNLRQQMDNNEGIYPLIFALFLNRYN